MKLTIGMPVYNNAGTIRVAVESLLAQTCGDFQIVISDDGSKDDTAAVCQVIVKLDKRVTYIRQSINLRYQNFGQLLREARTPYFMWAAGDDQWAPPFVDACIRELEQHPSIVLAAPRIQFEVQGRPSKLSHGTYSLLGTEQENLARYLSRPDDNSRMYGIFRTEGTRAAFPAPAFHGYDWAFSAATLRFGGHLEIPEVLMVRDETPTFKYVESVRVDARTRLTRQFPLLPLTRWLLGEWKIPKTARILSALTALNVDAHLAYAQRFHSVYFKTLTPFTAVWQRQLNWRMRATDQPAK
jgi:glycosyltransferase involved in cell wall biosynthesis